MQVYDILIVNAIVLGYLGVIWSRSSIVNVSVKYGLIVLAIIDVFICFHK